MEMVMTKLYTILDTKSEVYGKIIEQRNVAEFIRGFQTVVNDGKSSFSQYPEDFQAFEIGEYDEVTGIIKAYELPKSVCRAIDLKKETPSHIQSVE